MERRHNILFATLLLFACAVYFSSSGAPQTVPNRSSPLQLQVDTITSPAPATPSDDKEDEQLRDHHRNSMLHNLRHLRPARKTSIVGPATRNLSEVTTQTASPSSSSLAPEQLTAKTEPNSEVVSSPASPAQQTASYHIFGESCECAAPTAPSFYPYQQASIHVGDPHPNRAQLLKTLLDLTASNRRAMLKGADKATLCSQTTGSNTANATDPKASPLRVMLVGDSFARYLFSVFANRVVSDLGVRAETSVSKTSDPLKTHGTDGKRHPFVRWPPIGIPLQQESNVSKTVFEGTTRSNVCSSSSAADSDVFPPSPVSLRVEMEMSLSFGKRLDTEPILNFNPTHIIINRGLWDLARLRMNSQRRSMFSFGTGLISFRKRVDPSVPIFVYGIHKILGESQGRHCPDAVYNDVFYCAVRYANAMLQREEAAAQEKTYLGRVYYLDVHSITKDYPTNDTYKLQSDGVHFTGVGLERILDEVLASMVEVERNIAEVVSPQGMTTMTPVAHTLVELPHRDAIQNTTILRYPVQAKGTDCMADFANHLEFERLLELEMTPRNASGMPPAPASVLLDSAIAPGSLDFQSGRQGAVHTFLATAPTIIAVLRRLDAVQGNTSTRTPTHVGYLPSTTGEHVSSEYERALASAAAHCSQFLYNTRTIAGAHEELLANVTLLTHSEREELSSKPSATVAEQYERNIKLLKYYSRHQVPEFDTYSPMLDRCATLLNKEISNDLFHRVIVPMANPLQRYSCHDTCFIAGYQALTPFDRLFMRDAESDDCYKQPYKHVFWGHVVNNVKNVRSDNPHLVAGSTANVSQPPRPKIRHCPSLITNVIRMGPLFRYTPISEEYLFEGDSKYATYEPAFKWCVAALVRVGLEDSFAGLRYMDRMKKEKTAEKAPTPRALEEAEWNQHTCLAAVEVMASLSKLEGNATALRSFMLERPDLDGARVVAAVEDGYPVDALTGTDAAVSSLFNFKHYFLLVQRGAPLVCQFAA